MSEEVKECLITKEDLTLWIDRPPSNDDLDLCEYLANAVKLKYEFDARIDKAIKIIESYNIGKYDYSIPPAGIIDLLEILKGGNDEI